MNSNRSLEETAGKLSDVDLTSDAESSIIVNSVVDENFRVACGVTDTVVVTIRNRERPREAPVIHVMANPSALVGRGSHCDISLQDPAVSYRHAYLQLLDGRLFCFDLGSRSGTSCRSDKHRSGPLAIGEEIFIGPFSLLVTSNDSDNADDEDAWDVTPLSPAQLAGLEEKATERPDTVLNFLNGSPRPKPFALNRPVTLIGKRSPCRVKLNDDSVSRVHCSIVRTALGVWVVDLLGKGGTLVGGERVRRALLHEGDELTVGGFRMRVQEAATSRELIRGKAEITHVKHQRDRRDSGQSTADNRPAQNQTSLTPRPNSTLIPQPERRPAANDQTASTFSESFVYSLVDQFSAMQQQMFEQSQQTMTAMAKILQSRHEIEVELVRDEMAHIRGLSKELQELSRQLAERHLGEMQASSTQLSPNADEAEEQKRIADTIQAMEERLAATQPVDEQSEVEPLEEEVAQIAQPVDEAVAEAVVEDIVETPEPDSASNEADAGMEDSVGEPSVESADTDEDPHVWLSQRIAAIEKERTSRWKKITSILTGAGADDRLS